MAREPQEIPTSSGIYQIRCRANGKIYVGSAVTLRARWDGHRRELRKGLHLSSLRPEQGTYVRVEEWKASESQRLDLEA